MREWQPIETAPKDGTVILLYRYLRGSLSFVIGYATNDGIKPIWMEYSAPFKTIEPTHWMPMPEVPK